MAAGTDLYTDGDNRKEVGDFIPCDSDICMYCALQDSDKTYDKMTCDLCEKYDEFVGIECYKTVEDK